MFLVQWSDKSVLYWGVVETVKCSLQCHGDTACLGLFSICFMTMPVLNKRNNIHPKTTLVQVSLFDNVSYCMSYG